MGYFCVACKCGEVVRVLRADGKVDCAACGYTATVAIPGEDDKGLGARVLQVTAEVAI